MTLTFAILALLGAEVAVAQPAQDPERVEAGRALAAVYRESGFEVLVKHLDKSAMENPEQMVGACSDVARFFYWKQKDVKSAADILRAGLLVGETRAERLRRGGPEARKNLLAAVKGLAYDLGSFTWPGWNEPGLAITEDQRKFGLDAARTNLKLAFELKKDAGPMSAAHWLLGAHRLAARDTRSALEEFLRAKERAVEAKTPLEAHMTDGYIGITLSARGDEEGKAHLRSAIKALEADGSDDATFYAGQLRTAFNVFCGSAAGVGGWRSREFKGETYRVTVHLSRTASLFHAVDRMSAPRPGDEDLLKRYAEIRRVKASGVAETLLTDKNLGDALFAGVAAEHITQEEMMELGEILRHFAPRVDEFGDRHREALVVALESLREDIIPGSAKGAAAFCGLESFSLDCYLVPESDGRDVVGHFEGRVLIEVWPGEGFTGSLTFEIARACLEAKRPEIEATATRTEGLSGQVLLDALTAVQCSAWGGVTPQLDRGRPFNFVLMLQKAFRDSREEATLKSFLPVARQVWLDLLEWEAEERGGK